MKIIVISLILIIIVALIACNPPMASKKDNRSEEGRLYYFRNFDTNNRMNPMDGDNIIAICGLQYHDAPKGAHDGDGGEQLHLTFKKEEVLKKDTNFVIPHPDIDVKVSAWGSPSYFEIFPEVKGNLRIVDYQKHKSLILDFDLEIKAAQNIVKQYQRKNLKFPLDDYYRAYRGVIEWEVFDALNSAIPITEITKEKISGQWKAVHHIYENQKGIHEAFYFPYDYSFIVDDQKFSATAVTNDVPYRLENNTLSFDVNGLDAKGMGIINKITPSELIITWKAGNRLMRYHYSKDMGKR